jgi:DsbC/DsbD-like thiol-disulfide interchange protein/cytochrome c biogenesis protein CcdA
VIRRLLRSRVFGAGSGAALAVLVALAPGSLVSAAPVKTDHVEAELVAERTALVPGVPSTLALRLKIEDGWHTYWRNPGDSGLPTTLVWKLPPGFVASEIEWPPPRTLPVGPLVNYGYEGEVLHLVTLTPPANLELGGNVEIAARADWLVCKETCIPDGADLKLTLPVGTNAATDPRWGGAISLTRGALPQPLTGWKAEARGNGALIELKLTPPAGGPDPGTLRFFASTDGTIEPSAPQTQSRDAAGAQLLSLGVAHKLTPSLQNLAGVVTASNAFASSVGSMQAATIDVPLTGRVVAGPRPDFDPPPIAARVLAAPADGSLSLGAAALLALVGGLILNLMPCVLPVLSLKALSLAAPGHDDRRVQRRSGVAFAAGVVLTFVALAVALLTLRAAGEQVGWGFQLQSPAVVTGLAVLFFVLALNLSGVFEFATLMPGLASWSLENRYADAVLSGVLAVIIASPCTAPFMGAALGFALAQSAGATLAVFAALGVGMALPYLLLSWFPQWRRALPRPGIWMERLKQFLAFPLYATVAWLAWVLGAQVDNDAVVRLFATLIIVAFALWAWRNFRGGATKAWSVTALVAAVGAVVIAWPLFRSDAIANAPARAVESRADGAWLPYTPARLAELTGAGRPVFVDFTAAWCVTCQVNKRLVLNGVDVRDAFARHGVTLVRADWTRRDPAITRALAALGRNGVPVYVLYRPGREPLLLPEVLRTQIVVDALATL